jgi:hypothetical protein
MMRLQLIILALAVITLSSCTKKYTCICYSRTDGAEVGRAPMEGKKADVKEQCESPGYTVFGYSNVDCKLK